jgi:small subunit ribosomal protein S29
MRTPASTTGKKLKLSKFKKNKAINRGKTPLPGERKALRKRVLLSNSNALPVPGLRDVGQEQMLSPHNIGRIMSIPDELVDQLRAVEAFKPSQTWGIFRKPSVLIRAETVDLMTRMQSATEKQQVLRLVIDGDRISGKSVLLLQATMQAYLNDWIVVNVPEGRLQLPYRLLPGFVLWC